MAIWVQEDSKLIIQGITGSQGSFHGEKMVEYGYSIQALRFTTKNSTDDRKGSAEKPSAKSMGGMDESFTQGIG